LRRGGKRAAEYVVGDYLDQALANFSGYIAADELYDGPFCVLSIVDNRTFRRLIYEVLDHDPSHEDIRRFFRRFKAILDTRDLILYGITTDASPLYPTPITEVFGGVAHQICEFHTIAELTKAVLRAVAKVRKTLAAGLPQLPRGRPSKATRNRVRQQKRTQKQIADLFDHRYLFVQHHLTPAEKKTLQRITRGLRQLRTLREIMTEVYRLFDRRCCTYTALGKLARLRRRVRRFKDVGRTLQKLFSPNLEKALTFLNDTLLPSTSNAVERGNRRHRKMQKTVYRVRGREHIAHRIAMDMQREAQSPDREQASAALHLQRAG
jgi:Transposase